MEKERKDRRNEGKKEKRKEGKKDRKKDRKITEEQKDRRKEEEKKERRKEGKKERKNEGMKEKMKEGKKERKIEAAILSPCLGLRRRAIAIFTAKSIPSSRFEKNHRFNKDIQIQICKPKQRETLMKSKTRHVDGGGGKPRFMGDYRIGICEKRNK